MMAHPQDNSVTSATEQLCRKCGLCCDSTLFADVELTAGDKPAKLAALGLSLYAKRRGKTAFGQPCGGLQGKDCRLYADRPAQCRAFACALLKRVESGTMTAHEALLKIRRTQKKAEEVRGLLKTFGADDPARALTHRYQKVMQSPIDVSAPAESENRGELMLAVSELMHVVHRDFLSEI